MKIFGDVVIYEFAGRLKLTNVRQRFRQKLKTLPGKIGTANGNNRTSTQREEQMKRQKLKLDLLRVSLSLNIASNSIRFLSEDLVVSAGCRVLSNDEARRKKTEKWYS